MSVKLDNHIALPVVPQEPVQLDLEHIDKKGIKALRDDQISKIAIEDLKALGKKIKYLPPEKFSKLTVTQLSALTSEQIEQLSYKQIRSIASRQFEIANPALQSRCSKSDLRQMVKLAGKASPYFGDKIACSLLLKFPGKEEDFLQAKGPMKRAKFLGWTVFALASTLSALSGVGITHDAAVALKKITTEPDGDCSLA